MELFKKINLLIWLLLSSTFVNAQSSNEVYKGVDDNDKLYYKYNSDRGCLEVCAVPSGETPYYGDIVIPDQANIMIAGTSMSLPVKGICNDAFKKCTLLSSVNIPSSVTKIGTNAFNGCSSYRVNFSSIDHVLSIEYGNPDSNPMYTAGNTTIGGQILSEIKINTDIKPYAFVKATWLKEVVLGNNVKTIDNKAFYGCNKLESLVIPSVSSIGTNAFDGCTSLIEVELPSTLTSIGQEAFKNCTGLQYIIIPKSVNDIYKNAFWGCNNLADLIISSRTSKLYIAEGAFSSLKHIYSKAQTMPQAHNNAFSGKTDIQLFYMSGVDYNVDGTPWKDFIKAPIASNTITYYLDGKLHKELENVEAGTLIDPLGSPVSDRDFSGWKNEPRIMPNEAVDVKGSLKYKLIYVAGDTNDQLNKEDIFYFYGDLISDPKELKKDGLTYTITNSILTMPAEDYSLHVEYSLNQAPTGKTGLKYNNADQDLINYVSLKEGSGKITYSLDNQTFSDNIKRKDAGTYPVYYRVEGITPNYYTASSSLEVPVTIAPREITSFNLSQTSYTYDGDPKTPDPIVKYGDVIVPEEEYIVEYENNTNVGTEEKKPTVTITDKEGGNYIVSGTKTFTINKADIVLNADLFETPPTGKTDLVFNGTAETFAGTAQPLMNAGTLKAPVPGTLEYSLDGKTYAEEIPTGTDAKTYMVYYRIKGDNNHNNFTISKPLEVTIASKELAPEDIVITLDQEKYPYTGSEIKPDVIVKFGNTEFTKDKDYTVSYSNNKDVGTETKQPTVTIKDKDGGNYIVNGIKLFTISPAASKVKNAPTAKTNTYNGTDQVLINGGTSDDGKLQYSLSEDENTFSETIPTGKNAGNYTVYYRVKGDANHSDSEIGSVKVTIASKEITSFNLSQTSYTYDGNEKKPEVTVKDGNTTVSKDEYTISYTNNINVGTATVTLTDKADGNYIVSGSKTFTITKADIVLNDDLFETPPTGKTDLVFNGTAETFAGTAQPLLNAGTLKSPVPGTLEYSLDGKTYAEEIPTGTDAKTYKVYYRVKGDNNHNNYTISEPFEVTIAPKELTSKEIVITLDQEKYPYTGSEIKPDVIVKFGNTEFTKDKDYTVSYSNNKDVGTETKQPTVTIKDKDGGNYIVSGSKTFEITSAASSLTKDPTVKTNIIYNGTDQALINAGASSTGKVQYSLSKDENSFSETIPTGKNAGDYTVYYRVKGDVNHSDSEIGSVKVTIAPKEITSFNLSQTSYIYDGSEKKPDVTVKDGNTTVSKDEYTISYSNNINAGTATVTITDKTDGNFNVHGTKTFTINKADGSLKQKPAGIENLTYTGVAQNLITAGSSETGTLEYSLDKVNFGTTIPTGKDAKSYTVYYRVKGDANHKDVNSSQFNVTIAKAALTISVGNYEMFEGGTIPTFTINYDGLKNNETDAVLTAKPTVSCKATATSKAGDYTINVSGAKADNYNITHVNGKLSILAKVFVSGGDTSKDEDDPATYQITSSEGDSAPTVSITDDKDVSGKFAIPETVRYHDKDYTVTEISEGAFENNKNLTNVTIPSSITSIKDNAFKGCSNLESITVYNTTPINLSVAESRGTTRSDGSSVFEGVNKATCVLYVPDASVELYKAAPVWKEFMHIVPMSTTGIKGVTMTDDECFDIYNLQGQKVKSKATNLNGLPRGIYIINGKKYAVK